MVTVSARAGVSRGRGGRRQEKPKAEPKIVFQSFFKSVGPRTYAAQLKELSNGNQLLVLTEGKRDDASAEVRKTRLFVFAEDFQAFFKLLKESAAFINAHPLPEEIRKKRSQYWAKKDREEKAGGNPGAGGNHSAGTNPRVAGKPAATAAPSRAPAPAVMAR